MKRLPLPLDASSVTSLAFSADSATLFVGLSDGTLTAWTRRGERSLHLPAAHAGPIDAIAASPDGSRLATGGVDGQVCVWELAALASGASARSVELRMKGAVTALAWSADGRLAATDGSQIAAAGSPPQSSPVRIERLLWRKGALLGGGQGLVRLTEEGVQVLDPKARVLGLALEPEDDMTLIGRADGVSREHAILGEEVLLQGLEGIVCWSMTATLGSYWMVAGHRDGQLAFWHASSALGALEATSLQAHDGPIQALACAPDGFAVASAGADGLVCLWLQGEAETLAVPKQSYDAWLDAEVSPSGELLLGSALSVVIPGQPPIAVDDQMWGGFGGALWAAHGDAIVTVDDEKAHVRRFDRSGRQLALHEEEDWFKGGFAQDRQGRIALSSSGVLVLLDASLQELCRVPVGKDIVALAWSSNGLLAGQAGGTLTVWADGGARELFSLACGWGEGRRQALSWSPDGAQLAVAGERAVVVDVATASIARTLPWSHSVSLSPDGRLLALGSTPEVVTVWDLQQGRPIARWQRSSQSSWRLLLVWSSPRTLLIVAEHAVTRWTLPEPGDGEPGA